MERNSTQKNNKIINALIFVLLVILFFLLATLLLEATDFTEPVSSAAVLKNPKNKNNKNYTNSLTSFPSPIFKNHKYNRSKNNANVSNNRSNAILEIAKNDGGNFKTSSNGKIKNHGTDLTKKTSITADVHGTAAILVKHDALYLPYLHTMVGAYFSSPKEFNTMFGFGFFAPIWQSKNRLIFTDIRMNDRPGKMLEGNFHLGYRFLFPESESLYGIYAAFDRKRSKLGSNFNQLMLGMEYWHKNLFIGGNFYQPIGNSKKLVDVIENAKLDLAQKHIWITKNNKYESALMGVDAEVGYEFIEGLTSYIGGYYFKTTGVNSIYGPKAKISYDWFSKNGKRILGIFDKFGLEVSVQRDKIRGTVGYLSANFRIGLLPGKQSNLSGVSRHMIDLIHRDIDIVSTESITEEQDIYKERKKIVKIERVNNSKNVTDREDENNIYRKVYGDYLNIISDSGILHVIDIRKLPVSDEQKQIEVVFREDIDKQKQVEVSFPTNIVEQKQIEVSHPTNVAEQKQIEVSSPTNVVKQKQIEVSSPTNVVKQKQVEVSSPAIVIEQKQVETRSSTNVAEQKQIEVSSPTNVAEQKQVEVSSPTNVAEQKQVEVSSSTNVAEQKQAEVISKKDVNEQKQTEVISREGVEEQKEIKEETLRCAANTYCNLYYMMNWDRRGILIPESKNLIMTHDALQQFALKEIEGIYSWGSPEEAYDAIAKTGQTEADTMAKNIYTIFLRRLEGLGRAEMARKETGLCNTIFECKNKTN